LNANYFLCSPASARTAVAPGLPYRTGRRVPLASGPIFMTVAGPPLLPRGVDPETRPQTGAAGVADFSGWRRSGNDDFASPEIVLLFAGAVENAQRDWCAALLYLSENGLLPRQCTVEERHGHANAVVASAGTVHPRAHFEAAGSAQTSREQRQ
jgi:hypothetical protein